MTRVISLLFVAWLFGFEGAVVAATAFSSVSPILLRHCVVCHRPGGIAAQADFTSYSSIHPWAQAIERAVRSRQMPPWSADPLRSLKFRNDARLSDADIETLVSWVEAGSPLGRGSDRLEAPALTGGWSYPGGRPPDLVLSPDRDIEVPAKGDVPYQRFLVKLPLLEDRWISASEVRPGNASVVHHMAITEVKLDEGVTPTQIEALDTLSHRMGTSVANDGLHPVVTDPSNGRLYDMVGMYTPGSTLEIYPEDSGKLLKGGDRAYLNFNMHYASNGTATSDRTQVAFWFLNARPKHEIYRVPMSYETLLAQGTELLTDAGGVPAEGTRFAVAPIPPGADSYEIRSVTAFTRSTTIYQLQPHAHLRGKSFEYIVIYPDGRELRLLSVPAYDFRWQLAYDLATPLELPPGSKMVITGRYDNSVHNRFNPAPDKPVFFRAMNMADDEMFTPFVQYSVGNEADLPVVETVGCLVPGEGPNTWDLQAATVVTASAQTTSAAELKVASQKPAGTSRFRLIGLEPFSVHTITTGRVAVRGVLVGGIRNSINVTSFQPVGARRCGN